MGSVEIEIKKSLILLMIVFQDRSRQRDCTLTLSSRFWVSLCLSHFCFSGIAQYRAMPPQICPIAAEGGGWKEVLQLKLRSGGHCAIQGYR